MLPPIEIFILCYFSVDLVLGFFTAYEDAAPRPSRTRGASEFFRRGRGKKWRASSPDESAQVREVFVFDHRKIVWHYLSTFFIVDLISTIPFELMVDTRRGTAGV